MTIEEQVVRFCARPFAPVALLPEEGGARLFETSTAKELRIRWDELARAEEKQSAQRSAPYLQLLWHDGRQLVLADVGFAFAPSTVNTGPLPDLPAVLCFADFRHLASGIETLLQEDGRELEALSAAMICIALLDGARACGLPVDREERRLDALVKALEERGVVS